MRVPDHRFAAWPRGSLGADSCASSGAGRWSKPTKWQLLPATQPRLRRKPPLAATRQAGPKPRVQWGGPRNVAALTVAPELRFACRVESSVAAPALRPRGRASPRPAGLPAVAEARPAQPKAHRGTRSPSTARKSRRRAAERSLSPPIPGCSMSRCAPRSMAR